MFLLIGVLACTTILLLAPSWRVAMLLALAIWGFCRAYYFAFYVIEHWIDPGSRYSGLWDFVTTRRWSRARRTAPNANGSTDHDQKQ